MLNIDGRRVELFPSSTSGAPLVVLNTVMGEGGAVYEAVKGLTDAGFSLAAVGDLRWSDDMTPWPIPPIARGEAPCAGLADDYLELLTRRIVPQVLERLPGAPGWIALAGYSLGGLFALYAMYRAEMFARIASVSGSLWYPGFVEYAQAQAPLRKPDRLYLSVGDREGRAKNALMRPVEDNTRLLAEYYRNAGIDTAFEMNPGGHFRDPDRRMARGIAWMLEA